MLTAMIKPTQQVNAVAAVKYYKVYWNDYGNPWCDDFGPDIPHGILVGEWTRECDGYWDGWGGRPGEDCTTYTLTYGDLCEY